MCFFGYDCPAVQNHDGSMQPSELANLKVVSALVLQYFSHISDFDFYSKVLFAVEVFLELQILLCHEADIVI